MNCNINIMQDGSEIIDYDELGIPLYIRQGNLSSYPEKRAICHWHDDLEFIKIISGEMNYFVNGKNVLLKEGTGIMINRRCLHYGCSINDNDCSFICIIFHPNLLSSNKTLYSKYVKPILENSNLEYVHFNSEDNSNNTVLTALDHINELKLIGNEGYELDIISLLYKMWTSIFRQVKNIATDDTSSNYSEINIQKDMVSFIYQNYSEKLLLSDIAASGGVCRSKCCQIFKQYLRQSPIDFLNTYRLEVSCNLLKTTAKSITEIALQCGFSNSSYYIELFQRQYNCTPRNFRKCENR